MGTTETTDTTGRAGTTEKAGAAGTAPAVGRAGGRPGPRGGRTPVRGRSGAGPRTAARTTRAARAAAVLLTAALGLAAVAGCGSSGGSADSASSADRAAAPAQATADHGGTDAYGGGSDNAAGPTSGAANASGGTRASGGKRQAAGGGTATPAATYLVRTAQLGIRTPHVEEQLDRARGYAAQDGGYAGDENTTLDAEEHATSTVQLRVPAAAYDRLLTQLSGLGTLVNRTVSVKDVTGQVVDVQSRIASQRASVARVRALMDRAGSLTDVVSLESELSTRESDLEALEAQQASLKSQTNLATVTLRLFEPPAKPAPVKVAPKDDGFWTAAGHAARDGWHALYVTLRALLIVFLAVLPFAVVLGAGWLTVRAVRRRILPARGTTPGLPPARRTTRHGAGTEAETRVGVHAGRNAAEAAPGTQADPDAGAGSDTPGTEEPGEK